MILQKSSLGQEENSVANETAKKQENEATIQKSKVTKSAQTLLSLNCDTSGKLISNQRNKQEKQKQQKEGVKQNALRNKDSHLIEVTGKSRKILYDWMTLVASDHEFTRDTAALAMTLMDKYLERKKCVMNTELQALGFTAVSLAAKFQQNKCLTSNETFYKDVDTAKLELKILKVLEFKLHHPTYISYVKRLLRNWDEFIDNNERKCKNIKFLQKSQQSHYRIHQLIDIVDCFNLERTSRSIKAQKWTKQIFYILTRKYHQQISISSDQNTFLNNFYKSDFFLILFTNFIMKKNLGGFEQDEQLGRYLHKFLLVPKSCTQNESSCDLNINFFELQTHNRNIKTHLMNL